MEIVKEYRTPEEKELITNEMISQAFILIEERNWFNGNFLVFSDIPRPIEIIQVEEPVTNQHLLELIEKIITIENIVDFILLKQEGIL